MKEEQVELDVQIDENRLDEEWVKQSKLYHHWSVKAADARRDVETAKNVLDLEKAEVYRGIRIDPSRFGLEKVTEAAISAEIATTRSIRERQAELVDARHDYDVMQAAVSALEHKKAALENLVKLRLADYYGEPRAKDVPREAIEDMERKAIRRKVKRRKDD